MQFIDNLKWRYATKKFDTTKKVSQENIDLIKEAIQLSATSYGLQPFKVLEIKDPKLREELKVISWNQALVIDASHFFVFVNNTEVTSQDVDDLIKLKSDINEIPLEKLAGYGEFVKGKLKEKSKEEMFHWTAKQAYLGVAHAINAFAALKIDSSTMEGFEPEAYNKKLGLTEKGLNACVLFAVGYRDAQDTAQDALKIRKSIDQLFEEI